MTYYIKWQKTDDVTFRAAYLSLTGEAIQENPAQNETHCSVGSSRVTLNQLEQLSQDYQLEYGDSSEILIPQPSESDDPA